jgi:hypothetical protein
MKTRISILATGLLAVGILLMPFNSYVLGQASLLHYQVMKSAIKEVTNIDLDIRTLYSKECQLQRWP